MRACRAWLLGLLALALPCRADLGAGIVQRNGASLPLSAVLNEADGSARPLRDILGPRPALLMFGYYHCRNLCGTALDALARAVQTARLGPGDDADILFLSIDPRETAADAAAKQELYARAFAAARPQRWHFLSGSPAAIAAVAQAAGFDYRRDPRSGEYIHAAGLVVLAPGGRISSYLPGVAIDPGALRTAVALAAHGRIGALAERVLVLCSHLGSNGSRRSRGVLELVQALSLAGLLGLGLWMWSRRASGGGHARR